MNKQLTLFSCFDFTLFIIKGTINFNDDDELLVDDDVDVFLQSDEYDDS